MGRRATDHFGRVVLHLYYFYVEYDEIMHCKALIAITGTQIHHCIAIATTLHAIKMCKGTRSFEYITPK